MSVITENASRQTNETITGKGGGGRQSSQDHGDDDHRKRNGQSSRTRRCQVGRLTGTLRFFGSDLVPGQDHLHGLCLANSKRQTLRSSSTGDGSQLDLGLSEACLVSGVDDLSSCYLCTTTQHMAQTYIAHHGELTATAQLSNMHITNSLP